MPNKKINIAIIGLGKRGKNHLSAFKKSASFQIGAVCDVKSVLGKSDLLQFKNYKNVLKMPNLRAVSICLPNHLHFKVANFFLHNKINVLVEKPLAQTKKDVTQLYMEAEKNRVILLVGYHLICDNRINKIQDLIKRKQIGEILMVRARQSHNWGGKSPFDWLKNKKLSGGGTIIDNASHFLNLFPQLIGQIKHIGVLASNTRNLSVEDNAVIIVKFNNNAIGTIETSWNDVGGRTLELIIWGTKRVVVLRQFNEHEEFFTRSYKSSNNSWNKLERSYYYMPKGIERTNKNVKEINDPLVNLVAKFSNLINSRRFNYKNELTLEIETTNNIFACYESLKKDKFISLKK